ncbi:MULTISPECIES: HAMP domain-containing sensor histidine kinase [Paenibacillus]|uniref:Heme sensor protein HssS n=1 Tax=Paenibacillus odorifer TaxID=189426 RepID=A0A1R0WU55_9BACL|nr:MULTISPECIES: HAMP domain-containing sensor histidine kinase [Paenibacillus]AIQ74288.1 membrane protein [Paenibacillus odorifer]ETT66063.1 histidine kinase [Paenibacillus sp. FSL H8-237]MEC0133568.1 HAMP domain-containing sensor histidine kinase [Paenibacillus odorifer]MEC0224887.1 HAMP domain-containing sensor histidine kinase [Paenibacillus odorifer]OMD21406.1 two-component sensor histidine kinase [Paenibacillus odorifer]
MRSLYVRMCIVFCSVIVVSSLLGFLVSNIYYQAQIKSQNDAKLTGMAIEVQQFAESHPETMEDYLRSIAKLGYKIYLTDAEGESRFYGKPFRKEDLDEQQLEKVLNGQIYHGVADFPDSAFITGFFDNQLRNSIGVPVKVNNETYALFMRPDAEVQFGELRVFFAVIIGFTVLFSLGFVMISVLHVVRPITRLTTATKRISKGRYDIKLNTWRRDEIGQLASHFMIMSRELERTNRARQEFVANVSHEIESPLTSIQGFAQALKDSTLPEDERLQYLNIIDQESHRLSLLSKQLLTLSSLDYDPNSIQKKSTDLRAQLRQVVQIMEWRLTEKQLAVRLNLADISVLGDSNLLFQVWMNLLSNAIKYTPAEGSIMISAKLVEQNCIVSVSDTGEGISAEELPLIFDRFYKVDRARTHETHSSGLGLAISQKIVEAHNGTIEVTSTLGEGTTFTVTLPLL